MGDTKRIEELETGLGPGGARASLIVYHRDGAETIPLSPGIAVEIGRATPGHAFEDASLSARHASFVVVGDEVTVEDLGSTNGTYLGGKRIERGVLRAGDECAIGGLVITLHPLAAGGRTLGLDGHDRFATALEAEVARARFFHRPVSVVFVRALDRSPVRRFIDRVRPRLRVVDRAALYSDAILELLVTEAAADEALEIARAIVADRTEPRLVCGIASFPESASSPDELVEQAVTAARGATAGSPLALAGARTAPARPPGAAPIATSSAMRQVLDTAGRLAKGIVPVLLVGETGSGKEVLARHLHDLGPRRDEPFVAVNCGAIPGNLVESTLFGHEKGAFTGAAAQQRGIFEAAGTGTVFLDEIGELPLPAQAALLRVLETRRVLRIGATKEVDVAARIVAATHRDLEVMAAAGTFRSDLLYRLNALVLPIPPLRERREDLVELTTRFVQLANAANGTAIRGVEPDAAEALAAYAWPGNVRELRNAIERAIVIARGDTITIDDLPARVRASEPAPSPSHAAPSVAGDDFRTRLDRAECEILLDALRAAEWNQSECARRLRMPLRTLVYKIKAHGIKRLGYAT